ncbi:MAG: hypothetical protein AB7U82_25785 [Blastocatellales bacterium]
MANYTATFRSNYFAVKDVELFKKFCEEFSLEMITKSEGDVVLYGFLNSGNEAGIPLTRHNDESGEWDGVDFLSLLAEHLAPDYVAVVMEIGSEKMRYLIGEAYAINSEGQSVTLTLGEIYNRTAELGSVCTDCSY